MIAIVDYCKGNLKSVQRGFQAVGGEAIITSDADQIARAQAIVLPGVGSYADAARTMDELGQSEVIRKRIIDGVPFLGICLGLHLMYEAGAEGANEGDATKGLAVLPGIVKRMPNVDAQGNRYKIPHVGWNSIEFDSAEHSLAAGPQALLAGIPSGEYFYFTHSFIAPATNYTVAHTAHSVSFPSVVAYGDAAFGVQFHPEKSSDAGLMLLRNFVSIVKGS